MRLVPVVTSVNVELDVLVLIPHFVFAIFSTSRRSVRLELSGVTLIVALLTNVPMSQHYIEVNQMVTLTLIVTNYTVWNLNYYQYYSGELTPCWCCDIIRIPGRIDLAPTVSAS